MRSMEGHDCRIECHAIISFKLFGVKSEYQEIYGRA
jgi:hypothetical protein